MSEGKRPMELYVAASRDCAGQADEVAKRLRELGATVVSRWHDGQIKLVDPADRDVRNKILAANLEDLRRCSAVVALMHSGSPKATYAEIGWALAQKRRVFWIGPGEGADDPLACIFDAHPAVIRLSSVEQLFESVYFYASRPARTEAEQAAQAQIDEMEGSTSESERLIAKHMRGIVDERMAAIAAAMGPAFTGDMTQVGLMMAEATKALVSDGGTSDPLRHWMMVAFDLLALATIGGNAAIATKTTKDHREEMN